ncbi:sodium:proton antiporter [Prolixibacter bellariivorans]|uniref:Sodium:proton antiporter n=1 Tax=Prolixibacter bellariivorans TaxID=314319 RepID=A0A5M4B3P5_9BACT|nr:Na+/H+ antiporter NhaC [Prolixibacter bellariivorans]GET34760.1 sodium:proton antiporter [Prolixibacter bellariivorans]
MSQAQEDLNKPALWQAFLPIIFLITLLSMNVWFFEDTLAGANQIALLLSAAVAGLICHRLKRSWTTIQGRVLKNISSAMPSMLILLLIGSLAGTWMISGVVPAMIFYGLDIISPKLFLFSAVVVSAIVSVATGSSWSTVATIGVALLGIGKTLGFSEAVVAGAIISGAYFGDKMSPLSDTTNLAPAMAGTDIFTHIRYMMYTTVPTMTLTLIIFLIMGITHDFTQITINVDDVKTAIDGTFNTTPLLFIVPITLLIIIIRKMPALPALFIGTMLGALFAVIFQPQIIQSVSGESGIYLKDAYIAVMQSMFGDISLTTSDAAVNELLHTSGMSGMLDTIWLILSAMVFGGVMEAGGLLKRITSEILKFAHSTGSLVFSTVSSCIFFNFTASDQYLAIVVPGRMFSQTYRENGLKPELLSRTLEDSGTVVSVLIPWNTCGATQSRVLGVPTLAYLPYAFFNLISPVMTVLVAYLNFKIRRYTSDELQKEGIELTGKLKR